MTKKNPHSFECLTELNPQTVDLVLLKTIFKYYFEELQL